MEPTTKTITTERWFCEKGHAHRSEYAALRCEGKLPKKTHNPSNEEYDLLAELMEQELPKMEICRLMGRDSTGMQRAFGLMYKNYHHSRKVIDHERDCDMCNLYRSGTTLQGIGDKHGITRERVRQILSRYGITGFDGGQHVVSLDKKLERDLMKNKKREVRSQKLYGVDRLTHAAIKEKIGSRGIMVYNQLQTHVRSGIGYKEGTKWKFTLKTYCDVWERDGIEVQEKGYNFSRIETDGDFTPDNVKIITDAEFGTRFGKTWGTSSDYQKKLKQ